MALKTSNPYVQEWGCNIIQSVVWVSLSYQEKILSAGGVTAVLRAMRAFPENEGVQSACCRALQHISITNTHCAKTILAEGSIECIVETMRVHFQNEGVQHAGCAALRALANSKATKREIVSVGGVNAILSAMRGHIDTESIQKQACAAIRNIAYMSSARKMADVSQCVEGIVAAMRAHAHDGGVQQQGCAAMVNLTHKSASNVRKIVEAGGVQVVAEAMTRHIDLAQVRQAGSAVFWNLAVNREMKRAVASEDAIDALLNVMRMYPRHVHLTLNACGALWYLAHKCDDIKRDIIRLGGIGVAECLMLQSKDSVASGVMARSWARKL